MNEKSEGNASKKDAPKSGSEDELLSVNEKFELLSAYIDDEVSEEDRQKVEQWLVSDDQIKQQYKAQLKLSQAMRSLLDP